MVGGAHQFTGRKGLLSRILTSPYLLSNLLKCGLCEFLRHSNIGTTLNLYTQAVSEQKRAAHGQVLGQLLAV